MSRTCDTGPKAGGPLYLRALVREAAIDAAPAAFSVPAADDSGTAHFDAAVAALARDYSTAVAEGRERELPGPTGERNTWRTHPRGLTIALGSEGDAALVWLGKAMAAIAAGNPVLLVPAREETTARRIAAGIRAAGWPGVPAARATREKWSALADLAAVVAGSGAPAASAATAVAEDHIAHRPGISPGGQSFSHPAPLA